MPTLVETGYMDSHYDALFGMATRAGTPKPIIAKLNAALVATLQSPEAVAGFARLGIETQPGSPQQFAAIIAEEGPKWAEIVKITGIKVD